MSSSKPFRPLLACETPEPLEQLQWNGHFPMFASYKIDGIRALVLNGQLLSRTMKPIPNKFAQSLAHPLLEGLDGELLAQKVVGPTIYHDTYSVAMTHGSMEPLNYFVFDMVGDEPYERRQEKLLDKIYEAWGDEKPQIIILEQRLVRNVDDVLAMEQEALALGHEGLIVRRIDGKYKQGRSTLKEGHLIKVARTLNSEAIIYGFEELMHNENPAEQSALGFTKRASLQENLRPSGMMGALLVTDVKSGVSFKIGTGFDHSLREKIWKNQQEYAGKMVKYKYKPYGTKELPRQPSFLGFRDPMDM